MSAADVRRLCRLYRHVTIDLSRARTAGTDLELIGYLNTLAGRAHGYVYRSRAVSIAPLVSFLIRDFPRLVRRRWRPVTTAAAVLVLTSVASCLAVVRDPVLAYSLFDENAVEYENVRLEHQHGEYRGNFTFTVGESPLAALAIIGNNVSIAAQCFGLGALLCLPVLLMLVYNGRMLGTLTGLMLSRGYFIDFYSLIMTHGVIELTAICIAAGGGLVLGWAMIAPGALSRRDALRQSSGDAFGLLAGSVAMLIVAGLIEAHVTPHFPAIVRWTVALASACALIGYFGFAGRFSVSSRESNPRVRGGEGAV
jgi:uncharacterized membrane protein SpoIIM required for sporulation